VTGAEETSTYPDQFARLSPELRGWHSEDNGPWGAKATQADQRAQLKNLAQWTYEVLQTFAAERCPQGHPPMRHDLRHIAPGRFAKHAFFAGETCRICPNLAKCPVRGPNNKRSKEFRLDISEGLQIRDKIFVEQTRPEWRKRYRIRSGIEATMSELKRAHGMGALRVRTRLRVSLAVGMKVTACNIKRWLRGMASAARADMISSAVPAAA